MREGYFLGFPVWREKRGKVDDLDKIILDMESEVLGSREKEANVHVYGEDKKVEISDGKYLRVGDSVWIDNMYSGKTGYTVEGISSNKIKLSSHGRQTNYSLGAIKRLYDSGELGSEEFDRSINKGTKEVKSKIFEKGNILHIVTRVGGQYSPSRLLIKGYSKSSDKISAVMIAPLLDVKREIEFDGSEVYERMVRKMAEVRYQAFNDDKIGSVIEGQEIKVGEDTGKITVTKNLSGESVVNISWKNKHREKISGTQIREKVADSKNNGIPAGTVARTMEGYPLVMMFTNKPVKATTERKRVYYMEFQPMAVKHARKWLEKIYNSDPDAYWGGTSDPNIKFVGKKGMDRMLQRGDVAIIYRMEKGELEKNAGNILEGKSEITRWFFDRGSAWKATDEYILRDLD